MEPSESIFALLQDEPDNTQSLRIRESDVTVAGGTIAHALDQEGRRLLLVPLGADQVAVEDTGSRGVSIQGRELVDRGISRRFLAMRCEIRSLHETFGVLCDEVLVALQSDPHNPAATCRQVIDRWRELLGPRSQRLLGESAILGLLAELRFLERVVKRDPSYLATWTGPAGARFDFTTTSGAVEVKATTGRDRFTVEIHGLMQLEPPEGEHLYLWAEQLERVPTGGDSAPEVIRRIGQLGVDMRELIRRLDAMGYVMADSDSYAAVTFAPLANRAFRVGAGFPRLIRSALVDPSLADRITGVLYSVDLTDATAIEGHLGGPDDIVDAITRIR